MGQIREDFVLGDGFSAAFSRFLSMGDAAVSKMGNIEQSVFRAEATMKKSIGSATGAVIANMRQIGETTNQINGSGFARMEEQLVKIAEATARIGVEQDRNNGKTQQADVHANKLLSTLSRVVSVAAAFKIGKDLIGLSDTMTQTKARLNLVNDGLQDSAQLQEMIYHSANRARANYVETANAVAKMSQNAGKVFGNNAETIQFVENLNKLYGISGATQQEIASSTLQLTQALGSGVLRGQELNAVFAAAPNVIQTIADYMDVDIGKIREMAAEGKITGEIVKNALLSATDEIDARFQEMPMTWAQAAEQIKSAFVYEMDEILVKINDFINSDFGQQAISGAISAFGLLSDIAGGVIDMLINGAMWVADHWDYIYPVLMGVAAAFLIAGIIGVASGASTAVAWAAANLPLVLIVALIAILVYSLKKAEMSWEEMGQKAGSILGFIYAIGHNTFVNLWNLIATFAEFFANVFDDPATAISNLMFGLFDYILGLVEDTARAIDALLDSDFAGAVSGFRDKINIWAGEHIAENAIQYERKELIDYGETMDQWGNVGGDLGKKLDEFNFNMDGLNLGGGAGFDVSGVPGIGDIGNVDKVGRVGKIEEDVNLADEDLKMLRDLSERQYVSLVNLTLPQTNVSVNQTVNGGGSSDMDAIGDYLKNLLLTQQASHVG